MSGDDTPAALSNLTDLMADAAWQLNEALSMLREASPSMRGYAWTEDFAAGEAAMQTTVERLAEWVAINGDALPQPGSPTMDLLAPETVGWRDLLRRLLPSLSRWSK